MPVKADSSWENRTSKAILLIRILVGWVFLSEGIQKFLFPDSLGVGRFVKIGIPWPQLMDSLRAIARAFLAPFMIHELFPSLTETALGSHPCCVVSVTYDRASYFHGGNTGSNPVGDANETEGVKKRAKVSNCKAFTGFKDPSFYPPIQSFRK
jgi:hypothetical protein